MLLLLSLVLTATLPLINWLPSASWHDQQRLGQVLVLALGVSTILVWIRAGWQWAPGSSPLIGRTSRWLIALVGAAAVVSAALSRQPLWSFVEVALGGACVGFAVAVATLRRRRGATVDHILLAVLFFTCAGLLARFAAAYAAALIGDSGTIDAWLLVDGFSNPRFYGQFLTLALPLLAAPALSAGRMQPYRWLAVALTVLLWTAAITSGTRGTWLGLACAIGLMLCMGRLGRRWAVLQIVAAAVSVALFWLLLIVVPGLLGLETMHNAAARLTTSLSRRDIIWGQAFQVMLQHPLLGIGPMQLASLPNGVAAHPHQAWLQWAAELGVPSALVVTGLVLWGGCKLVALLRRHADSRQTVDVLRLCLTAALTASLAQAMVDGVLVMPYSQLWLAILAGWLLGLPRPGPAQPVAAASDAPPARAWVNRAAGGALVASVALLGLVVVRDFPQLAQREQAFAQTLGGHLQPRFWLQGIIAPEVEAALATIREEQAVTQQSER